MQLCVLVARSLLRCIMLDLWDLMLKCCCTGEDFFFFSPTVLFTLGRYWHRQVSSQLSLHHALYMRSSQTDERKMVGERDESMRGKRKKRGRKRVGNRKAAERWM